MMSLLQKQTLMKDALNSITKYPAIIEDIMT